MSEGISPNICDICKQDPDPPNNSPNCNGQMPICNVTYQMFSLDMMDFDVDNLPEVANL
jgi:hypothetical protein